MEDTNEILRHEVFVSGTAEGLSRSLGVLKTAAVKYINEHDLTANVLNLSESIYAWARSKQPGVSRASVTVWFRYPRGEENPPRRDSWRDSE